MGFGKIQCVSSVVFSRNLKTTSARGGVIAAICLVTYANTLPPRISLCLASHRFSNCKMSLRSEVRHPGYGSRMAMYP